ncbi:hypothetical protein EJ110_NYTH41086 [Nymphaea thermarum]|nr:hypothetical protein EJ110_NYTH41086 [Nymphaea thermarum]
MDYVYLNTLSVSHDTQLEARRILNVALEKNGSEFFRFGYDTMRSSASLSAKAISISPLLLISESLNL